MKPHRWLSLVLLALLLVASPALAMLQYGEKAPDFALKDVNGKTVRLSDFAGKIIVLKLSTTWCPTCNQQLEEISSIKPFLDKNGIVVIDVYLQDTEEMVRNHQPKLPRPANYYALLDDGRVRDEYAVYLIPRLLIIDGHQRVRRDGSLMTGHDMTQALREVLKAPDATEG